MKIILISIASLGFLFTGESTATYQVDGMMCAINCPQKVNKSLDDIDGIKSCKVDFESKTAIVVYDNKKIDSDKIARAITKGTYYIIKDKNIKKESSSFWKWLFGTS